GSSPQRGAIPSSPSFRTTRSTDRESKTRSTASPRSGRSATRSVGSRASTSTASSPTSSTTHGAEPIRRRSSSASEPERGVSNTSSGPVSEPTDRPDAASATTGRSVVQGGLWYLASYGIPQGYTLVLSIVAARFLGPSGMGVQSFIAFVSVSTTSVLSGAMYVALMRFVGEMAG